MPLGSGPLGFAPLGGSLSVVVVAPPVPPPPPPPRPRGGGGGGWSQNEPNRKGWTPLVKKPRAVAGRGVGLLSISLRSSGSGSVDFDAEMVEFEELLVLIS